MASKYGHSLQNIGVKEWVGKNQPYYKLRVGYLSFKPENVLPKTPTITADETTKIPEQDVAKELENKYDANIFLYFSRYSLNFFRMLYVQIFKVSFFGIIYLYSE